MKKIFSATRHEFDSEQHVRRSRATSEIELPLDWLTFKIRVAEEILHNQNSLPS